MLTLLLLWLTIGWTVIFAISLWWLRLILLGIAVGVTIHLVKIKTYRPEPQDSKPLGKYSSDKNPA